MSELKEIKPIEVMLGNFIDSMGSVEMVTGIAPKGDGEWIVGHKGWGQENNPIEEGILYTPMAIPLTEEWKIFLGIEKYKSLPGHIKYVHEAQNWFLWHLGVNLHENIRWHLLPKI